MTLSTSVLATLCALANLCDASFFKRQVLVDRGIPPVVDEAERNTCACPPFLPTVTVTVTERATRTGPDFLHIVTTTVTLDRAPAFHPFLTTTVTVTSPTGPTKAAASPTPYRDGGQDCLR